MSTPEKLSPGANAQEEKPRLTEEQKRQNHISSGECLTPAPLFSLCRTLLYTRTASRPKNIPSPFVSHLLT